MDNKKHFDLSEISFCRDAKRILKYSMIVSETKIQTLKKYCTEISGKGKCVAAKQKLSATV